MTNEEIQKMQQDAVKAKVEKAVALGMKASWTMSDHLDLSARILEAAVQSHVEYDEIRDVVQKTYNHSAFAQKLEKAFEKFGHFQREGRGTRIPVENFMEGLAKEIAAKEGQA